MEQDRADDAADEERPSLVIGPTEGDADVEMSRGTVRRATRSDDWITAQIRQRLEASSLAPERITVDVKNADVVLRGDVSGPAARHLADQIAESVAGVRRVRNELRTPEGDAPEQQRAS